MFDAKGRLLLPGLIDDQVHFREPGLTAKGDLATESAAAVAGGVTSFFDMPNVNPQTITREALADKYRIAAGRTFANHAFYMGTTNDNLSELEALKKGEACAIKIFMGASTGNMLVDNPDTLDKIFQRAPVMIVTHCEDTPMIKVAEDAARAKYGEDVPFSEHPYIRSAAACHKSTELAVGLSNKHGTRLHVLHMTSASELHFFAKGPIGQHGPDTGRMIERSTYFERAAHWSNAIAFSVLAISGLVMAFGKFFLLPVLGGTLFGALTYLLKTLHNFVGPLFAVSLVIVLATFLKDNIASAADFKWLMKGGGLFKMMKRMGGMKGMPGMGR